jgi:hypothetical protein
MSVKTFKTLCPAVDKGKSAGDLMHTQISTDQSALRQQALDSPFATAKFRQDDA